MVLHTWKLNEKNINKNTLTSAVVLLLGNFPAKFSPLQQKPQRFHSLKWVVQGRKVRKKSSRAATWAVTLKIAGYEWWCWFFTEDGQNLHIWLSWICFRWWIFFYYFTMVKHHPDENIFGTFPSIKQANPTSETRTHTHKIIWKNWPENLFKV